MFFFLSLFSIHVNAHNCDYVEVIYRIWTVLENLWKHLIFLKGNDAVSCAVGQTKCVKETFFFQLQWSSIQKMKLNSKHNFAHFLENAYKTRNHWQTKIGRESKREKNRLPLHACVTFNRLTYSHKFPTLIFRIVLFICCAGSWLHLNDLSYKQIETYSSLWWFRVYEFCFV